ncbi:DL-endopeptidase inhibitor IseA family protein [Paenibacillus sp. UNC451MF]|uniref:DL-endopeptidase inhibitor IseA family protein n=1 Tax=Paenibacillus sp. UNC451MF TaxID=1449063 RepID=UPI00048BB738|nr:DL-endopeptidase inhibitor IseA family protein [Paenibacillus sp. UNC451MF]
MFSSDKLKGFLLGTAVASIVLLSTSAYAGPVTQTISAAYSNIKLYVNGQQIIPKDSDGVVVEPFIYDGTTYLPVRAVAEALKQTVNWDQASNSIYIGRAPEGNHKAEYLSDQQAMELLSKSNRAMKVSGGGTIDGKSSCQYEAIPNDPYFRSYSCGFKTKSDVKQYLEEVFTPAFTANFMEQLKFIEINGRLAQQIADGGTIYDWSRAEIQEKQQKGLTAEVEVAVPVSEGFEVPVDGDKSMISKLNYEYVQGQGWRMSHAR